MNSNNQFVDQLTGIQNRYEYTDQEMADLIGCSRQLYQKTRTGKIPLGNKILRGAVKAFPELYVYAYIFLTDGADIKTEIADTPATPHQTPCSGQQGGFMRRLVDWVIKGGLKW